MPSALTRLRTACSAATPVDAAARDEVLDALHREVRVDRGGAVADEQRDVVDLADVTGLDDQADLGARLLADQVVVDRGGEQQRRDRREVGVGVAVGEHDEALAVADRLGHLGADLVEPARSAVAAAVDAVQAGDADRAEARAGRRRR